MRQSEAPCFGMSQKMAEVVCSSFEGSPLTSLAAGLTPTASLLVWLGVGGGTAVEGLTGIGLFLASVATVAVPAVVASGIFIITTIVAYALLQHRKQLLDLNYATTVQMSMQVLEIPSSLDGSQKGPITSYLLSNFRAGDSLENLEELQRRLNKGIKDNPEVKSNWHIEPTLFWPKWLFNVAKIEQLRDVLSKEIRVGAVGPTEAGKSELLTVLTGAPEKCFRAGGSSNSRTMEIQLYQSPKQDAIFIDCPGTDDQDSRIREMGRMFEEMFDITLFLVPSGKIRSQATNDALTKIAAFLRNRKDFRPVRILVSKVDQLDHHRIDKTRFRNAVQESKRAIIDELKAIGRFDKDFTIQSRQASGPMILLATETLEDIVKPFSTRAQMSLDHKKALSDCPPGTDRMIEATSLFKDLYKMAEEDELWDVESLRQWLLKLSPNSVPSTGGRTWQEE